jgi:pyruvate formate lyase activating enzyme
VTTRALIFDIKRGSSEDGPGIRTTVFFKGCPLACVWCQNPEGINHKQEIDLNGDEVGSWITLEELLYRVRQDKPFYDSSGGGVTLSGGEATLQLDFVHHFLKALKSDGIHTAIETCGLFNYERFKELALPYLDLIYFDLKLFDDFQSRRHTGCSNKTILKNFSRLISEAEIPVIPRIPLIPGITDTEHNLSHLANLLREQGVEDCTLIPYNPTWQDKLKKLGREAKYEHSTFLTPEETTASVRFFRHHKQQG